MQDNIKIDDAQIVEEGLLNYVSYHLKGTRNDIEFSINRRYNDFVSLKEAFLSNWPACFVPPIPSKKHIGNLDANTIAYRQKYLNYFLKKISQEPYLWNSEEMEVFINCNADQLSNRLTELIKQTTIVEIISKYNGLFQEQTEQQQNQVQIDNFQIYITSTLPMIANFQKMAKNIMKARDNHNYEQVLFIENFLPQFEQIQFASHEQVFSNEDTLQQFKELKALSHKNEFIKLYDYTKAAERELEACRDALETRNDYVNQLKEEIEKVNKLNLSLQGVHTKTIFSFRSKEEKQLKIKEKLQNAESRIGQLKELVDLLNNLLINKEIPTFNKLNKEKYVEMIRYIAKFELKFSQAQVDYWERILLKI